ncbi:type VI secretion system tube protein Hcp [Spirosoma endophyticum]|uniref:Type VI secretion system effector, Hcp1 family n=1 Tax=Spirosoma endophyticum TaxID=662367 RepID=A0A1I1ZNS8_9BACT|nr:type VI secretion system tube protein Hcp [Spirosoma endophyticum]SFE33305.1 type VI secretion system effector, Hcp1 family [Spirosoma endophyticum]
MKSIYFCTALLVCLLASPAFAQVESQAIYMKITDSDGNISGDVTTRNYVGFINLASAQFSMTRPSTESRATLGPITITKAVDVSSTRLMQTLAPSSATKSRLDNIEIDYVKSVTQRPISTFYKIELTNVSVTHHSVSLVPDCPNGCSDTAESFELTYQRIKITTYSFDTGGRITADPNPFTYDLQTGAPF